MVVMGNKGKGGGGVRLYSAKDAEKVAEGGRMNGSLSHGMVTITSEGAVGAKACSQELLSGVIINNAAEIVVISVLR
jgi:hypothetical protein